TPAFSLLSPLKLSSHQKLFGCIRLVHLQVRRPTQARFGGQARIRTLEDISQQIYSLPPLAAWVPARDVSLFHTNQLAAQAEDALLGSTAQQRQANLPVHSSLPQSSKRLIR